MKYTILYRAKTSLTVGALIALSPAFGQNISKKIALGVSAGINYSLSSPNPTFEKQITTPGFRAGLGGQLALSERFSITSQACFLYQLTKYSTATLQAINSYSWFGLPTNINYTIAKRKRKQFVFGLGLSPQRLILSKIKITENIVGSVVTSTSNNNLTNDWNLFALAQTGVRFSINQRKTVLVLLSYEQNISRLEKTYPMSVYVYNFPTLNRISSITLSTSYYF